MLAENNQTFGLFSYSFGHETTVVVKAVYITFITCVEKNRTRFGIPVCVINKISDVELCTVTTTRKMVYVCLKEVLFRVGS